MYLFVVDQILDLGTQLEIISYYVDASNFLRI